MSGTARSQTLEPFLNFRFRVEDTKGMISGGFSTCTLPEQNISHIEYSEGNRTYSFNFPGRSSFTSVTLHKGVFLGSSDLARWIRNCAEGRNYRTDLVIHMLHRTDVSGLSDYSQASGTRRILCKNCMPIRFRPGADMDGLNQDVSVEEIEIQPEYFYVISNGQEIK